MLQYYFSTMCHKLRSVLTPVFLPAGSQSWRTEKGTRFIKRQLTTAQSFWSSPTQPNRNISLYVQVTRHLLRKKAKKLTEMGVAVLPKLGLLSPWRCLPPFTVSAMWSLNASYLGPRHSSNEGGDSWRAGIFIWLCRNEQLQVSQNVSESISTRGVRLGKSRGVSNHVGEERGQPQLPSLSFQSFRSWTK